MQACQDEKVNACITKPCDEFQACINALSKGGGGEGGQKQQGQSNPGIEAKFKSCQPKGGDKGGGQQQPPSGGSQPPKQQYPDHSQIQQQIQQQMQQQGGDQSAIPQGFSSWADFCKANPGDSRCAAYQPQIPQYPYLPGQPRNFSFGSILNLFLVR